MCATTLKGQSLYHIRLLYYECMKLRLFEQVFWEALSVFLLQFCLSFPKLTENLPEQLNIYFATHSHVTTS